MDEKTQILLGVAGLAVAGFFFFKKDKPVSQNNSNFDWNNPPINLEVESITKINKEDLPLHLQGFSKIK